MKKKTRHIVIIWIALFAATFGIRKIIAAKGTEQSVTRTAPGEPGAAMQDLEAKPRRTQKLWNDSAYVDAANDQVFEMALSTYLREHALDLRGLPQKHHVAIDSPI
jgi:hypothetical protein